ncbi:MAG: dihydrolipoyl dehydrogenase [Candidatus Delongbacteria bacterium]|jgi:dihydrolipoamide dehydrogenase|nr:dihydrolipoyl dehydrogenase [Candidatus Delongbacteria bacterium]
MDYDVLVLGGGPGGYTAAIRANQYGLKTAIIEKDKLGGTCLNRGCIPTKSILASTDILAKIKKSEDFGITVENIKVNIEKIIDRKQEIVDSLVGGLDKIFKLRKIEVFNNFGKITSNNEITLDSGEKLTAKNIILATGSEPLILPFFNIDHKNVITSDDALEMREIPEKLLVIGGGVVGCEFAGIYKELGSEVTIVEMLKNLVPTEDAQVSRTLQTSFKKKGVTIKLKTKVEKVEIIEDDKVKIFFSDGSEEIFTKVLAAGGRSINTKGNGIDELDLKLTDSNFIDINEKMQTSIDNVYAIGDITGKWMLAHVAATQGLVAVANIVGKVKVIDYDSIPSAIFTNPEIASIGAREQQLKEDGIVYKTGRFSFAANGKAKGLGETDGFVKVLTDESGEKLLGAHIVGPHASDLLQELVLIKSNKLSLHKLIDTVHPHPTLCESVLEAAESVFRMGIHSV